MKRLYRHLFLCVALFAGSSSNAQVIDAPLLHCISVNGMGDDVLTWSLPTVICGTFNGYNIYRSTSMAGPYTLIASITTQAQTSYTDNVGNGATQQYFYYMQSDFNCPGYTAAYSDTLDNRAPDPPQLSYVTVTNGLAEIAWDPGASPETYGYILYRFTGSFNPIDTIIGRYNTDYIDATSTPQADSMSYSLAAIDSCYNTGAINKFPQHSIFLRGDQNRCQQKVILNWYSYDNWASGVKQQDIEASVNGAPYTIIHTVSANVETDTLSGFNDGDSVCFRIVATENTTGLQSTSNVLCMLMNVAQPVTDFYVRNITVTAPGNVLIRFSIDSLSDVAALQIFRGLDSSSMTLLAGIPGPFDFSVVNEYNDATALTDAFSYYYQLMAIDSCGDSSFSTLGKSILLKGYSFTDQSFFVSWDASWFDSARVMEYDLYRKDDAGFNLISSLSPETFSWEEENTPVDTPCYYVEAIDSMILSNGFRDTIHSRSNVVCLDQPSVIYMPNAFSPEGKNNLFKPILNTQGITSYSFAVFNRWGEQIFASTNPADGWDGKYKGRIVPQGAYAYLVHVTDGNGKAVDAKGTVLVIR